MFVVRFLWLCIINIGDCVGGGNGLGLGVRLCLFISW